jgi:hypothetical protein
VRLTLRRVPSNDLHGGRDPLGSAVDAHTDHGANAGIPACHQSPRYADLEGQVSEAETPSPASVRIRPSA